MIEHCLSTVAVADETTTCDGCQEFVFAVGLP